MHLSHSRALLLFCGIIFFISCGRDPSPDDVHFIDGYWEIQKVTFSDGVEKAYSVNTAIEYFKWDGTTGYRKKMQPTVDGKYLTSNDALPMEVIWRDGVLLLGFSGGDSQWEEEVLKLDSLKLTTRHSNGILYSYKRYEPFSLKTNNGEEGGKRIP